MFNSSSLVATEGPGSRRATTALPAEDASEHAEQACVYAWSWSGLAEASASSNKDARRQPWAVDCSVEALEVAAHRLDPSLLKDTRIGGDYNSPAVEPLTRSARLGGAPEARCAAAAHVGVPTLPGPDVRQCS
jgi:hypothetical protein